MTGVDLRIEVEEFNDASKLVIYDKSNWDGQTANITAIQFDIVSDVLTPKRFVLDAGARTSFITNRQITILPAAFTSVAPDTEVMPSLLPDGYFEITATVTFADLSVNTYTDNQGFIAFLKAEALRANLNQPDAVEKRFMNLHVFLYAAQAAASTGKPTQYKKFVAYVRSVLDNYNVSFS